MNKFRHRLIVTLGSIGIGLSPAAFAAEATLPVTASATIDWSQLQLAFTSLNDSASAVTFSNHITNLSIYTVPSALNESDPKSIDNWIANVQANADAETAHADGIASSLSFSGNAIAMDGSSYSSGYRAVDFSVDGPGVLTVTVPYTLSLTGARFDCNYCFSHYAGVSGDVEFHSYITDNATSYSNASFFLNNNGFENPPSNFQAGTLVFGIVASDAGEGSLAVHFYTSATRVGVVPEPETYAMLLAGLGLISFVARRRSLT